MKKVKANPSIWNMLKLYCGNHKEDVGMSLINNIEKMKDPYFICPCEGCLFGAYPQRITILDYEKMADIISDVMSNQMGGDITNYRFSIKRPDPQKQLDVKVIYSNRRIGLSIK